MKVLAPIALAFTVAAPALATEYKCETPKKEVSAYLVFDDGPGGLDDAKIVAWGQQYADVVFDNTPRNVQEVDSRDTYANTFEYGGDKLEIGFDAGALKLDFFAARTGASTLEGKLVARGKHSSTKLALSCQEL